MWIVVCLSNFVYDKALVLCLVFLLFFIFSWLLMHMVYFFPSYMSQSHQALERLDYYYKKIILIFYKKFLLKRG